MTGLVSINTNYDALNAGRFFNQNISNLSKANAQLASGRIDSDASDAPAAAAVGANLDSQILTQTQAASNVTQACALISLASGSLQTMIEIGQRMKTLATQSNSEAIGPSQRTMLDTEYQALLIQVDRTAQVSWNNVQLFTGSNSGTSRLGANIAFGTTGTATDNISANLALSGFIADSPKSINVTSSGGNGAIISLVGANGTSFEGSITYGQQGLIELISQIDSSNIITIDVTGTGLTSTAKVESELKKLFQLDVGNTISIRSASTDLSTTLTSIDTGAGTLPGTYGLSYGYDNSHNTITYKISNGQTVWEKTYDAFTATNATAGLNARTVVFDNGLTVTTAANTDETNPTSGIEIFTVNPGNALNFTFQVGDNSTDTVSINFNSATTTSLKLSGTSIATQSAAANAANAIDNALIQLSNMIAQLGGTKSQLNFTYQNLELQIQNERNAKATFTDADITTALQDAQESTALVNMSSTIFQNTLQSPKRLAELVQTVMRS